jgi:hypothetical protein
MQPKLLLDLRRGCRCRDQNGCSRRPGSGRGPTSTPAPWWNHASFPGSTSETGFDVAHRRSSTASGTSCRCGGLRAAGPQVNSCTPVPTPSAGAPRPIWISCWRSVERQPVRYAYRHSPHVYGLTIGDRNEVPSRHASAQYHDLGANPGSVVEVDHVSIGHSNAPGRDGITDGLRLIGAVNPVHGGAKV